MDKKKEELVKKFKESNVKVQDFKDLVEFATSNIETFDLENENDFYLGHMAASHLFKNKLGNFDKTDANFLVNYLAKLQVKLLRPTEPSLGKVNIKVLNRDEYEKVSKGSRGVCIDKEDSTFDVVYSEKVSEDLMSRNPSTILRGFQTISHEITHILQGTVIHNKDSHRYNSLNKIRKGYMMTLETITRKSHPDFYEKNYDYLLKENDADANGLKWAMQILKIYSPDLYNVFDQEKIQKKIDDYNGKTYGSSMEVFNHKLEKGKMIRTMEFLTRILVQKDPQLLLDKYPVLNVAYNRDGKRKSITDLLSYREEKINNNIEEKSANDLVMTILNSRSMSNNELKCEIDELQEYVLSNPKSDEFIYELIKKRCIDFGTPEEVVEKYISLIKKHVKEFNDDKKVDKISNMQIPKEDLDR